MKTIKMINKSIRDIEADLLKRATTNIKENIETMTANMIERDKSIIREKENLLTRDSKENMMRLRNKKNKAKNI